VEIFNLNESKEYLSSRIILDICVTNSLQY